MTPQEKIVGIGAAAGLVAHFYFKKSWSMALLFGLAAISAYSVLTAHTEQ